MVESFYFKLTYKKLMFYQSVIQS